jgi:hypothetical protein
MTDWIYRIFHRFIIRVWARLSRAETFGIWLKMLSIDCCFRNTAIEVYNVLIITTFEHYKLSTCVEHFK